ncbi:hypothetical protein QFZ77_006023 [Paenibacillus sp. V4I3]|nr:hypothetical protein [Paenibacillus sp. V4I3]MDQ0886771.1 hypothetical protein [Paenibacillus sp. V4I9]
MFNLPIHIKTYRMSGPRLNVFYPAIVELSDSAMQQQINQLIVGEVNRQIHQQGYPQNPKGLSGYYEIKTNERGVFSLSLYNESYTSHAHRWTLQNSLTIDVQTGKLYTLQDLFVHGVDYVKSVSEIIGQQIKDRRIPLQSEFKGIRPDQDFYIADKALVVFFQLEEITAYVYGFQYFPISVYEIQNIINEQPLGTMMY